MLSVFVVGYCSYLIGHSIGDNKSNLCNVNECKAGEQMIEGLFYIFITLIITIVTYDWIKNNWMKANKKAKKDIDKLKGVDLCSSTSKARVSCLR